MNIIAIHLKKMVGAARLRFLLLCPLGLVGGSILGCSDSGQIEVGLTLSLAQLERGMTEQVELYTDEQLGEGTPMVAFSPPTGLLLGPPVRVNDTTVSVEVQADVTSPLGARTVLLTTSSIKAQGSLEVVAPTADSGSIACTPSTVKQGVVNQTIGIIGTDTTFDAALSLANLQPNHGAQLSALRVTNPQSAALELTVAGTAQVGARQLVVTTGDEAVACAITIDHGDQPAPTMSATPTKIRAGTEVTFTVIGTGTHFSAGSVPSFDDGAQIAVSNIVVTSATQLSFIGTAAQSAVPGTHTLTITSPFEQSPEIVTASVEVLPAITMVADPDRAWQGAEQLTVQLLGSQTHFNTDTVVQPTAGSGVRVDSYTVINSALIEAVVSVSETATVGQTGLLASTTLGTGVETVEAVFQVLSHSEAPMIELSDNTGDAGESFTLVINGTNTHFETGVTELVVTSGEGLTVDDYQVDSPTRITAQVTIAKDAPTNTVTLAVTTGEETVTHQFEVISEADGCTDLEVVPNQLSIGRFNKYIYFRNPDAHWVSGETEVVLEETSQHIYLGTEYEASPEPTEICKVTTPNHISCEITVGLQALLPEESEKIYLVKITTGDVTLCGKFTVFADDIEQVTSISSGTLPGSFDTYEGTLNPAEGNRSDFYEFNQVVNAGDTLVFHAFSKDRLNLDPVLRLIEDNGVSWLVYKDDETANGIDSRLVYHFDTATNFYLEVGPKLDSNFGDYDLYVYRLSHGGTIVPESGDAADDPEDSQIISSSTLPYLVYGQIGATADDGDCFQLVIPTEGAAIDVVARRLGPWFGSTADLVLKVFSEPPPAGPDPIPIYENATWYEAPSSADPRGFLDPGTYNICVYAEDEVIDWATNEVEQSHGFYAINVRPLFVINEIDARGNEAFQDTDDRNPFVEILGPPATALTGYQLCGFDGDANPLGSGTGCFALSADHETDDAGYLVVYQDEDPTGALALSDIGGKVELHDSIGLVDTVQYGIYQSAVVTDTPNRRTLGRGAGVDTAAPGTDEYWHDFIQMADPTPGGPNDRTCQAAVPLFEMPL